MMTEQTRRFSDQEIARAIQANPQGVRDTLHLLSDGETEEVAYLKWVHIVEKAADIQSAETTES